MAAAVVYFAPRPKRREGVNLLSGEAAEKRPDEELAANEGPPEWISFLKPNVTITMVDDFTPYAADKVPDHVSLTPLHPCLVRRRQSTFSKLFTGYVIVALMIVEACPFKHLSLLDRSCCRMSYFVHRAKHGCFSADEESHHCGL